MVRTTGEHSAYYDSTRHSRPVQKDLPPTSARSVERIRENCEPAFATVLFMAGAGGSLRAGVTENPVRLTRSVQTRADSRDFRRRAGYVWPGGGITFMVDVTRCRITPSAMCRRRRSWRRSNSPCGSAIMPRSAAIWIMSVRSVKFSPDAPRRGPATTLSQMTGAERQHESATAAAADCATGGCICTMARSISSSKPSAKKSQSRRLMPRRGAASDDPRRTLRGTCRCCAARLRQIVRTPDGAVARRMADAALPFCASCFITPMAAVAGAVAEEVLAAMTTAAPLPRAYVNNGGDIALHLLADESFHDRPRRSARSAEPVGNDGDRDATGCAAIATSGLAWPQLLARHCRRRHRVGARRQRWLTRPPRLSRMRSIFPAIRQFAARPRERLRSAKRSRRATGDARRRPFNAM